MSLDETALLISITALVVTIVIAIGQIYLKLYSIRKTQNEMKEDALMFCRDLKRILTDFDKDNEEERYEVDLSLKSYFNDNTVKIRSLSERLSEHQSWYSKKPELKITSELLEWIIEDFYDNYSDEEERIRIWSQNIPAFHHKYLKSFPEKKHISIRG